MTFPLTPASPFVAFVTKVTAATLNAWRTAINQALDGTAGGTYTPSPKLTINGDGMSVQPLTSTNLTIPSGSAKIASGATLEVQSGGFLQVDNGAVLHALSSSTILSNGAVQINGGTFEMVSGSALIDSGATLEVKNGADLEVDLGATFNMKSTMTVPPLGAIAIQASAILSVFGTATIQSGGTLSSAAGSTATLGGTNTLSGVTTLSGGVFVTSSAVQSQSWAKSGASAITVLRQQSVNSGSATINPASADTILVGANLLDLNGTTYTVSQPGTTSTPDGVRCRIVALATVAKNTGSWSVAGLNGGTGANATVTFSQVGGGGSNVYNVTNFLDIESIGGKWQPIQQVDHT